jgi:hypothetical protein
VENISWPLALENGQEQLKCSSRRPGIHGDPRFTILHKDPPNHAQRNSLCRHSSASRVPNPYRAIPPSTQPSRPQVGSTIRASSPTHRTRGHPRQGAAARYNTARTDKQDYRKQERWTLGFRDLTTEQMSAEHGTSAHGWGRRGQPPTGRPAADGGSLEWGGGRTPRRRGGGAWRAGAGRVWCCD